MTDTCLCNACIVYFTGTRVIDSCAKLQKLSSEESNGNMLASNIFEYNGYYIDHLGVRSGPVGCSTALLARRLRLRFPIISL